MTDRHGLRRKLEIAYGGTGKFAATCIRFRKAIEDGSIKVEDYSNYQMTLRFLAGAMGVPFLPTTSTLGTDIINRWGFSKELRMDDPLIRTRNWWCWTTPSTTGGGRKRSCSFRPSPPM